MFFSFVRAGLVVSLRLEVTHEISYAHAISDELVERRTARLLPGGLSDAEQASLIQRLGGIPTKLTEKL